MVNVKLATSGGLREALATAQVARENEVDLVVGYMPTTPAIAAAPARASAADERAIRIGPAPDLDGGLWRTNSPVEGGPTYDVQLLRLSPEPGAGIIRLVDDA